MGTKKTKKFKETRALVRIALNDGMTQEEIAKLCRTQQSVVSKWSRGEAKASEAQIQPLLHRYGARLSRTAARSYIVPRVPEEHEVDEVQRALESMRKERGAPEPALLEFIRRSFPLPPSESARSPLLEYVEPTRATSPSSGLQALLVSNQAYEPAATESPISQWRLDAYRANRWALAHDARIVRVHGPVIFRYTFVRFRVWKSRDGRERIERVSYARWIVHRGVRERLALVLQTRRELPEALWAHWRRKIVGPEVDAADDFARWFSTIEGPFEVAPLLERVDALLVGREWRQPHDEMALPLLLRKALSDAGYPVEGVSDFEYEVE